MAANVLTYQSGFLFDLTPDRLWEQIERFDQYESWWPWLTGFGVERCGGSEGSAGSEVPAGAEAVPAEVVPDDGASEEVGLAAGLVLHGTVAPPLPYRMRLRIEIVACRRPCFVDATIGGDLVGEAGLRLEPEGGRTRAEVAWTVEMRQPAMRIASRIGRPLLQWGHDRVVDMTVSGFRRTIEGL